MTETIYGAMMFGWLTDDGALKIFKYSYLHLHLCHLGAPEHDYSVTVAAGVDFHFQRHQIQTKLK